MNTKQPLIDFAAALTWEQIKEHEARTDIGVRRRTMLASLTRSGPELFAAFSADDKAGETMTSVLEQVGEHLDYLKSSVELAEDSYARLLIVADAIGLNVEGDADETLPDSCEEVAA